ncbi:MAG TPA: hypothetical protein VGY54_02500 [Polyangiaceae bacterium]|jgi:chromosome segregation ATPase|nr:hypothetical protein [Polyangiaceae bacterium]
MHAPHPAFSDFHQVINSLEGLSERQQITTLKFELFHALQRANDYQSCCSELEQRIAELRSESAERVQQEDAIRRNAELVDASSELARVKSDHAKRLWAIRLELVTAQSHCDALEEMCRSLLLTVEQAARSVAEADAPRTGASGIRA